MDDDFNAPQQEKDICIGHAVYIRFYRSGDVERAGLIETHRGNDGHWCSGVVPFTRDPRVENGWQVISEDPLTISPSVLCTIDGHHGFIREGRWIPA